MSCVWLTHYNTFSIRYPYLKLCLLSALFFTFGCKVYVQSLVGLVQFKVLLDVALLQVFHLYLKPTPSKSIDKPAFQKFSGNNRLHLRANFTRLTKSSLYNMPFYLKYKYFIPYLLSSLLKFLSCM